MPEPETGLKFGSEKYFYGRAAPEAKFSNNLSSTFTAMISQFLHLEIPCTIVVVYNLLYQYNTRAERIESKMSSVVCGLPTHGNAHPLASTGDMPSREFKRFLRSFYGHGAAEEVLAIDLSALLWEPLPQLSRINIAICTCCHPELVAAILS